MKHKFPRVPVVWVLLAVGTATAQTQTIPLHAGSSRLEVTGQSVDHVSFRVEVAELQALSVTTKAGIFTQLVIPGFHSSMTDGAPELPMMNRLLAVPVGARVRVETRAIKSRVIDLAAYGITSPLLPHQPSLSKSADPDTATFAYNPTAYDVAKVSQELARVVDVGQLRAMVIGRLEISPVEFMPRTNQLQVVEEFEVKVVFEGVDLAAQRDLIARTNSPYFELIYDQMANSRGFHDSYPDLVRDVVTMVIITPPEFEAQLQDFVEWKTRRGFHVVVGVTGTPAVGTTNTSIQTWLHGLYNNATPELPAPSFVLLVGDVEQMPTFLRFGDPTDRLYGAVGPDYMPDMYYGRLSAENSSQLQAILDKTMAYDQFTMLDPSYLAKVVMVAGMEATYGPSWLNGAVNYGTENYFNAAHGITSDTYLHPNSGSQYASIVANASEGRGFLYYTGHGNTVSWYDPTFTQADINGLADSGKYGLVVGNACFTGDYDTYLAPECLAETWLRAPDKGAIGYIGACNTTYWNEDYYFAVGYRTSIVAHPAYSANALGGFDGLFHDHGEAAHLWYVTTDALVFCGNLAVAQSGSSNQGYYWKIYNLMGDPSLTPYFGVPTPNTVSHLATVFTTHTSLAVSAAPNSYVGLTQDGVLVGAGTVGAAGTVTIPFLQTPLTPGVPLHMVVMGQNRQPYQAELAVIVPTLVNFSPSSIAANTPADVTVTVLGDDGITPQANVNVWAAGLDYTTDSVATDDAGQATLSIDYPYGPSLDVVGWNSADPHELFRAPLPVAALPLTAPDLNVTTAIGLVDSFAVDLPGSLHATVTEPGFVLHTFMPDGTTFTTGTSEQTVTPDQLGDVRGVIAVDGHDVYSESFPVITAYGTLSGTVTGPGGEPLAAAAVRGYDAADVLVFTATSEANGVYAVVDLLPCGPYSIRVDHCGCQHLETPLQVNYGANTLDLPLALAPTGVLSGLVSDADTGVPLSAVLQVYRSDTMALYTTATTDPVTGMFTTPALPYFDYVVRVRSGHHRAVTMSALVDQAVEETAFLLEPATIGVLVIDDDGFAASEIAADLDEIGFSVTVEPITATNAATWSNYDLVVLSCGNNLASLAPAGIKTSLAAYVTGGGGLLIEGGEVGHSHYPDAAFAASVLHASAWVTGTGGYLSRYQPAHPVFNVPNVITTPPDVAMAYTGSGDEDAMVASYGGVRIGNWALQPLRASIIVYDPDPDTQVGQIVYFTFNYAAMDIAARPRLLENAVTWLLALEGNATVSGQVNLHGGYDYSGVTVRATPNGGTTPCNLDGTYTLTGLYGTDYTITAERADFVAASQNVTVADGQQMTGVDLTLVRSGVFEDCSQVNLPIPDNNPAGLTRTMTCARSGLIAGIEVTVDIRHTYIGDLELRLTSPAGTEIYLHAGTDGASDNIIGTFPTTLTPAQPLTWLLGQQMDGEWKLRVADLAVGDTGTFVSWCLKLTTMDMVVSVGDGPARALGLAGVYPNPFNPQTKIAFDLPRTIPVDLAVYDVRGRRVAILAAGVLTEGRHEVVWTGRDDNGRAAASGVYFCRLVADGRTLVRKMTLVK